MGLPLVSIRPGIVARIGGEIPVPRCEFWCCAFLLPRRGRNRKAQAGGTPLAGSALGILWEPRVSARIAAFRVAGDEIAVCDAARLECLVGPYQTGNAADNC